MESEGLSQPGRSRPGRASRFSARFWWDFLVGDTPELFVAVVVIVGITALLAKRLDRRRPGRLMPVLVVTALVVSVLRGRRSS